MTNKIYRSAQGKSIDLGTIMLQNETVRAVGNMKVNARGDKLDNNNRVIETKPRQIQRQNARATNVSDTPVQTSVNKSKKVKKAQATQEQSVTEHQHHETAPQQETPHVVAQPPSQNVMATPSKIPEGGLAGAIARQREVKQELEKTRRQQQQGQGLRKL
jgi:hypothetical protein